MRGYYGILANEIDVTGNIMAAARDGIADIHHYNEVFSDPHPNISKHLKLVIDDHQPPIYIREDIPISISVGGMPRTNIHLVCNSDIHIQSGFLSIHIKDSIYTAIYKVWELSHEYRDDVIILIPPMKESWIRRELYSQMCRWEYIRSIFSLIPSITRIGYSHDADGNVPYSCFWARSSYIRSCQPPHRSMDVNRWLSTGASARNMHECFDAISVTGYRGFVARDLYNLGSTPIPLALPSHNGGCLSITPTYKGQPQGGFGLFNQLGNIYGGCVIAYITGRSLQEPLIYPHYSSRDTLPLSSIIDVEDLRHNLDLMGVSITNRNSDWYRPHYHETSILWNNTIHGISELVSMEGAPNLDIGCSTPVLMTTLESISIMRNMKFSQSVYKAVQYCASFITGEYDAIHLRLEDDWINAMHIDSQNAWAKYKDAMAKTFSPNRSIYVCTHLGKSTNMNNHLLDEFRNLYPNVITGVNWRTAIDLPVGREIDALIDYLVCMGGRSFIGMSHSTYSLAVAMMMAVDGKPIYIV